MIFKHAVPILYSSDIRRSLQYYTEVLGFDSKWEWGDPPTFGGVSKDLVDVFFCKDGQGQPGTWVAVMVNNVEELYERIKTKEGRVLAPPEDKEWGLREMLVEDPDGHVIRVGQPVARDHRAGGELTATIRIVERIPTCEEFQYLVRAVGWKMQPRHLVETLLKAPIYAAVAQESKAGSTVGCVLLLGDGASFYYIKDMMVHPDYQCKRVGTALMQKLNDWLEGHAAPEALVGLYTGENLAPFYRQFGFRESFGMSKRTAAPGM